MIDAETLALLRCPLTGQALKADEMGQFLYCVDGSYRYPLENGIALLLAEHAQEYLSPDTVASPEQA